MEHKMLVAFPGAKAAKLYRLNRNHHVRVWCSCMGPPVQSPLTNDPTHPGRLGMWDWLGVADVRIPGSASEIFKQHLTEVEANVQNLQVQVLPRAGGQQD